MKSITLLVVFLLAVSPVGTILAQQTQPVVQVTDVTAEPGIVGVYQAGTTAVVKFRARFSNSFTTGDFRGVPVLIATYDSEGREVTAETTKCRLDVGECTVRSDRPRTLHIGAFTGPMGKASVALNFVNLRVSIPAVIDITASQAQAQEGTSMTLVATSPVNVEGPVVVRYRTMYSNDRIDSELYLPGGIRYGQRVEINTESIRPLSFRERRTFRVEFINANTGLLVASGYGNTVGLSEWKGVDATLDPNGDLVFTLDETYNAAVDYTVTLLRGNQFRVELAQMRGEIYAYPEGSRTKLVFNRGSLGDNAYYLPHGFYTVNVQAHDRSTGINWTKARTDALGLNAQYTLR